MGGINPKWANLTNKTRYFIITGGRGSGKSFEVGRFITLLACYPNERILFTRETMTSAHLSVIPEVVEKINFMSLNDCFEINKTEIRNINSKSTIIFKGLHTSSGDQTANLKSLTGVTAWVLDEAEELTDESKFDKIDLSFRKKGTQTRIILILNPATKTHWIYKRFFESKGVADGFTGQIGDTTYIHSTYLDNIKNLDSSFIDRADDMKINNPSKYDHIMLGGWLEKADGVILTNWEFGEFDDTLPFMYGSDWGFKPDPDVLVKVAIDKKLKRLYVKEEFAGNELTATELVDRVKQIVGTSTPLHSESQDQRITEMLRRANVKVYPTKKYPNSVIDGIKMLQDWRIIVSPESTEIAKELNNYCEKNGQPISNGNNHRIDAIRYVVMSLTETKRATSKVNLV